MPHGLIYLVCLEIIEEVIDEKKDARKQSDAQDVECTK